jgi:hypothetical protein
VTWHRLDSFSFKDLLAIVFTVSFLVEVFRGHESMVNLLVPLIGIILTGYFATEGYSYWLQRRDKRVSKEGKQDGDSFSGV